MKKVFIFGSMLFAFAVHATMAADVEPGHIRVNADNGFFFTVAGVYPSIGLAGEYVAVDDSHGPMKFNAKQKNCITQQIKAIRAFLKEKDVSKKLDEIQVNPIMGFNIILHDLTEITADELKRNKEYVTEHPEEDLVDVTALAAGAHFTPITLSTEIYLTASNDLEKSCLVATAEDFKRDIDSQVMAIKADAKENAEIKAVLREALKEIGGSFTSQEDMFKSLEGVEETPVQPEKSFPALEKDKAKAKEKAAPKKVGKEHYGDDVIPIEDIN